MTFRRGSQRVDTLLLEWTLFWASVKIRILDQSPTWLGLVAPGSARLLRLAY